MVEGAVQASTRVLGNKRFVERRIRISVKRKSERHEERKSRNIMQLDHVVTPDSSRKIER